jgi:ribosome-binding protein aMBF1 (putative translation factor)
MRNVQVSDDPAVVWLSPERCRAARALLNWSPDELARQVTARTAMLGRGEHILAFEDYGEMLSARYMASILAVLLLKVEFTTVEGEPGVVRKRHVGAAQGGGYVQFGGERRRRPPL